jgi:hypothetical protein
VISSNYGSLSWQYRYDRTQETNPVKKMILTTKAVLIVIIVGLSVFCWFILGIVTCGILWPKSMRRIIFGNAALANSTDMEELHNDVVNVADDVNWIRKNKEQENKFNQTLISKRNKISLFTKGVRSM